VSTHSQAGYAVSLHGPMVESQRRRKGLRMTISRECPRMMTVRELVLRVTADTCESALRESRTERFAAFVDKWLPS
jgi:hypothetical protein